MPGREPTTDVPAPRPFQFQSSHLMLVAVVCSFLLALILYWGVIGFVATYVVACLAILIWGTVMASNKWSAIGYGMLFVGVIGSCMFPLPAGMRPSRSAICRMNLEQIMLALQAYERTYGSFPPAYVAGASGKPLHSWRILILPYLDRNDLYNAYHFDEPWDGPHNRKLHGLHPPRFFSCPASKDQQARGETNYVAVLGEHTMWPGAKAMTLIAASRATAELIMVVEVHNSGIHWMEPRDLHVVQMPMAINPERGMGISSPHNDSAHAGYVDGDVGQLYNKLPPESLRRMLTIAGGEPPPAR